MSNPTNEIELILTTLNQQNVRAKTDNNWTVYNESFDAIMNVIKMLLKSNVKLSDLSSSTQEIVRDHAVDVARSRGV